MSSFTTPLAYIETGQFIKTRKIYRLTEPFKYEVGELGSNLVLAVPVGFETDLASVPSVLSGVFHPEGYWAKAAVIHDFLYKTAMVERVMADLIFLEAMQVLNVSRPIRLGFFFAVRLFGRRAYQRAKLAAMDLALEPARKQNGVFDDAAN